MKKKKIGRNSPCPCGSGKKFKKCCSGKISGKTDFHLKDKNEMLPPYNQIDYGPPKADEDFFNSNTINGLSPQRFIYSGMLNPGVEKLASKISNQLIDRGKTEKKQIENTDSLDELLKIFVKGADPVNHEVLVDKLLQRKNNSIPLILDELKTNVQTRFVESAIRIIHVSGIDCSKELYEIISNIPTNAYKTSLLCMLLGFYYKKEYLPLMWNYYKYLKEHYPGKTYCDGPLLGLIEMREQEKEKNALLQKTGNKP